MRPVRLSEVRKLLSQSDFQDWWEQLRAVLDDLQAAQHRWHQSLRDTAVSELTAELAQKNAIDTLYRAGECEDAAVTLSAEAADAENAAFQLVSQYEDLRIHVSEAWYRLGALEKSVDERKEAAGALPSGKKEEVLRAALRAQGAAQVEYDRLAARKTELWERVEAIWARQAESSLRMTEAKMRGKRTRTEAEARFQDAERLKAQSERSRAESERTSSQVSSLRADVTRLLAEATTRFGCAAGEDFLYFRQKDQASWAFCLALVEDGESYNVEVRPLAIYSVEQKRGVTFLEPARERAASPDEGDKRFEEYFLSGRKGRRPAVA